MAVLVLVMVGVVMVLMLNDVRERSGTAPWQRILRPFHP